MGNCLPKLKKQNKVSHSLTVEIEMERERTISEILSRSSTSVSLPRLSSDEDRNMVKAFKLSSDDDSSVDIQSLRKDENIIDELKDREAVQKAVCFQVDYVQGMPHRMPSRLAERMEVKIDTKNSTRQLTITEEDELFMDEIVEEVEARELLEILQRGQIVAQILREKHLQGIRDKARRMSLGLGVRGGSSRVSGARGEREG